LESSSDKGLDDAKRKERKEIETDIWIAFNTWEIDNIGREAWLAKRKGQPLSELNLHWTANKLLLMRRLADVQEDREVVDTVAIPLDNIRGGAFKELFKRRSAAGRCARNSRYS